MSALWLVCLFSNFTFSLWIIWKKKAFGLAPFQLTHEELRHVRLSDVAVKMCVYQPVCEAVTDSRLTGYDCDSVSSDPDTSPPDLDGWIAIYNLLEMQFPRVIVVFLMGCVE